MEPTPSQDRFERLNQILNDALELPPAEREPYILRACGADESLRHSVQSMLSIAGSNARANDGTRTLANAPSLRNGDVLEGGYRILRLLGRGGMGEVYEAEDPEMDEHVAIKTIRPDIAADDASVARFRKEIQLGRKVSHPNVCNIYSIGKHGPLYFFTMELLRGETLGARLRKRGRMTTAAALPLLSQMAEALNAAHDEGIIHRDFKPANVMLLDGDTRRKAVVTDFGLARLVERPDAESRTGSTHFAGTPAYMAPEQLEDAPLTKATDIYALGLVAYEMVTGHRPFDGATDLSAAIQRLTVKPRAPLEWFPELDANWNSAILRCLERQPGDRWASACDFVDALSGKTGALQTVETSRPAEPRHWWRWASVAVLVATLAAAIWILRKPAGPPQEAADWLDKGTAAVRDGLYWTATTQLGQALAFDRNLAMAYARRAEAWNEMDCPDKAASDVVSAYAHASGLSGFDQLYLEAIDSTVASQSANAVQQYQAILEKLPDDRKHFGHVDLGRAYEKHAEPLKALEEYRTATKEWQSSPGAWLRLGVLEGNLSRARDAKRDLDQALEIYREKGDTEGQVQTRFEIARLAGASKDSDALLVDALGMAGESVFQKITIGLQRSYVAAKQGRLDDAKRLAEEAKQLAEDNGMPAIGGRVLNDLGNALYIAGKHEEAKSYYKRAIAIAKTYHAERVENAARMMMGQTLKDQEPEQAKKYFESSRAWFFEHGYAKLAANGDLMLGRIERNQGDYDGAQANLKRVRSETADPVVLGSADRDLSNLYAAVENYPAALEQARSARELDSSASQTLADDDETIGAVLLLNGRFAEADKALDQARAEGFSAISLMLDRAQAALLRGDFKLALQFSGQTLRAADPDPADVIEAKRVSCLALLSTSRTATAKQFCEQAMEATKSGPQAESVGIRLANIRLAVKAKDAAKAMEIAAALAPELERNGQRDSLWRCLAYWASAAELAGNDQQAVDAVTRSRLVFQAFIGSLGAAATPFQERADTRSDLVTLQSAEQRLKGRAK